MVFLDTLKGTLTTAVEAVSNAANTFLDRQRINAKLIRLRGVMKSESELMNRAYIALGKGYYEQIKKGEKPQTEREEKLVELIDNCKAKIARARDCYRKIVESQNEFLYVSAVDEPDKEPVEEKDVVDITVACSNESDYDSSPFEQTAEDTKDVVEAIADELIDDESPIDELF